MTPGVYKSRHNMSMDYKAVIGRNIRYYRELKGWNQATLGMLALDYPADKRNAAQQKIKNIELGRVNISINDLLKIANTLNVLPAQITVEERAEDGNLLPSHQSSPPQSCPPDCTFINCGKTMVEKCKKVINVLKSDTDYADALSMLIDKINNVVEKERTSKGETASLKQEIRKLKIEQKKLNSRINEILSLKEDHNKHLSEVDFPLSTDTEKEDGMLP